MLNPMMVHQASKMLRMSQEWDTVTYTHVEALIYEIPGANKPKQIYEMMDMGVTLSRRKARVATQPAS